MAKSLLMDFGTGLILLVSLIGFHTLGRGVFTPVLDFYMYPLRLFESLQENFMGTVFYWGVLVVHMLLAAGCLYLRVSLNEQTNIVDVIIISMVPALILCGITLVEELWRNALGANTPYSQYFWTSFFSLSSLLSYSANTLVLFIGVLASWFIWKVRLPIS
jgi:hypothetical protein